MSEVVNRDEVVPGDRWEFNQEVASCFDDMLARSIPDYAGMRALVTALGLRVAKAKSTILDLGCSRGEALAPFVSRFGAACHHVGLEVSEPMIEAAQERFKGYASSGIVSVRKHDLREGIPTVEASLVLSVLTLCFVPVEYRQGLLRQAFRCLKPGGGLILVEKVLGTSAEIDGLLVAEHHEGKRAAGYTEDQIVRKKLALEGVLVPVTARWNEELLRQAGFQAVDCFWRKLNFAGWLALRLE